MQGYSSIHYIRLFSKIELLGYLAADIRFTSAGEDRFVIDKAYYFFKKGESYIVLGSVDKNGLYDKDGNCIKSLPPVASQYDVIGISSLLIEDPLGPSLALQSKTNGSIRESNPFVIVDFDTVAESLKLMDLNLR
jgi:hypothetical protein